MEHQVFYAAGFLLAYIGVIALMEYLHRYYGVKAEYTRKMAHASATISSLLFLVAFDSYWYVFVLGIIFFIIFYFGRKYNILQSLESVGRKTSGTYILPMSVFLIFLISQKLGSQLFFILPVLIVGISDPLAAYVGNAYSSQSNGVLFLGRRFNKTILGTTAFMISALMVSLAVLFVYEYTGYPLLFLSFGVAIVAAFVEMISEGGLDNITVPLAVIALLYFVAW